jgi:DNA repair ATPase RecN
MLKSLSIKNVGLARDLELRWARRFNVIGGDNGAGKSFLLDLSWWALTRTWADAPALPDPGSGRATINAEIAGKTIDKEIHSAYNRETQIWSIEKSRPAIPGIVVYIRVDGSFSV